MSTPDFAKGATPPVSPYDTSASGLGIAPTYLGGSSSSATATATGGATSVSVASISGGPQSIATAGYHALTMAATYDANTDSTVYAARGGTSSQVVVSQDGYYEWVGWADFSTAGGNQRILRLALNGSLIDRGYTRVSPNGADPDDMLTVALIQMTAGDYVELQAFQDSGAGLTVNLFSLQATLLNS